MSDEHSSITAGVTVQQWKRQQCIVANYVTQLFETQDKPAINQDLNDTKASVNKLLLIHCPAGNGASAFYTDKISTS